MQVTLSLIRPRRRGCTGQRGRVWTNHHPIQRDIHSAGTLYSSPSKCVHPQQIGIWSTLYEYCTFPGRRMSCDVGLVYSVVVLHFPCHLSSFVLRTPYSVLRTTPCSRGTWLATSTRRVVLRNVLRMETGQDVTHLGSESTRSYVRCLTVCFCSVRIFFNLLVTSTYP